MTKLSARIRHFLASEDGPTAVEYALMIGLIATAVIAAMTIFGNALSNAFNGISDTLTQNT